MVLGDLANGGVEGFAIRELLEQLIVDGRDRALGGNPVVVAVLEFFGVGAECEDGEQAVSEVVVAPPVAEEHVIFLMVLL